MNVAQMTRMPGVRITGIFDPTTVAPRVKTMATRILQEGQTDSYNSQSYLLARWAANQVDLALTRPSYTIPPLAGTAEQRQAIYDLCNADLTAALLRSSKRGAQTSFVPDVARDQLDSWFHNKKQPVTPSTPPWMRNSVTDLSIYFFTTFTRKAIQAILRPVPSAAEQAKRDAAIALLNSTTPVTFQIK